MASESEHYDVCVVGGAGHVGVPLSIALASRSLRTLIYDINESALNTLREGRLPFLEEGAESLLREGLEAGSLHMSQDPALIARADHVILTIGTPIDEFHNPQVGVLTSCVDTLLPYLREDATLILRSTVAPGVTAFLDRYLKSKGREIALAFCPERVVQGKGVEEIQTLPQIVSGTSERAVQAASALFGRVAPQIVEMQPGEAEFAKLICNTYRYIEFAATNQLCMIVESAGYDYNEVLRKMKIGYPRIQSMPTPGFAAGPCLMKDTMQLFSFGKHSFPLGQVAMTINEGMPNYIVERLALCHELSGKKVGILGMAFKAESDDIRDSLSFKLRKLLAFAGAEVLCADEFIESEEFVPLETVLAEAEICILGVPHKAYRNLTFPEHVEIIDIWGIYKK